MTSVCHYSRSCKCYVKFSVCSLTSLDTLMPGWLVNLWTLRTWRWETALVSSYRVPPIPLVIMWCNDIRHFFILRIWSAECWQLKSKLESLSSFSIQNVLRNSSQVLNILLKCVKVTNVIKNIFFLLCIFIDAPHYISVGRGNCQPPLKTKEKEEEEEGLVPNGTLNPRGLPLSPHFRDVMLRNAALTAERNYSKKFWRDLSLYVQEKTAYICDLTSKDVLFYF